MNGTEIERRFDEHGSIYIFDDGPYRYLSFGEGGEQSRIELSRPHYPVYQYYQAMLLALLFNPEPRQIMMLGLGGGAMVHSLLAYSDNSQIRVAELRKEVYQTAVDFFQLPDDPRLEIAITDAGDYLQRQNKSVDLIFTDIYSDQGMQQQQLDRDYLSDCYRLLSDEGILVLNLWDQGQGFHPKARQQLSEQFGEQWLYCPVDSGNLIAFAFKSGCPDINPRNLQKPAKQMEKHLEFPARRMINRLRLC